MKDIADALSVSVMTVSLALRNSPEVSMATREKVNTMARKLGYKRDPALSSLIAYRSKLHQPAFAGVLAYINNYDRPNITRNPLMDMHCKLFRGASERGGELGYKVEEFWLRNPDISPTQSTRILQARGIQGLLLGPQQDAGEACPIPWEYFSCVKFGYSLSEPHLHTVCPDQFIAMKMSVEEFILRGYQRIAMVFSPHQNIRSSTKSLGAYLAAIQMAGLEAIPPFMENLPEAKKNFLSWYSTHQPDAIICSGNKYIDTLEEQGIKAGKHYGLITPHVHAERPHYAQIDENYVAIGRRMAELVVSMIQHDEKGVPEYPTDLVCGVSFVEGKTVRKMPRLVKKRALLSSSTR